MSKETEQKPDGGSEPAGMKEEYREEGRYSVPLSSGDASGDAIPPARKNDGGNDDASGVPPSGPRPTREELEAKYRKDPRFFVLFNHEPGKKKKNIKYVKVGGIRLTPKRILILSIFFLIFLACLGASFYYAIKDIGKYMDYLRASDLYEAGDYAAAKDLFVKVINEDPNKEKAIVAMAEIYHHDRDWGNESFFRQRIMRLNPLNRQYYLDYLESSFRARNFGSIYSILNLKVMESTDLPPEEGALYLISALQSGHAQAGKAFYADRKKANPKYFMETERGRLADLLLNGTDMNREEMETLFTSLDQIGDPLVRFETGNILLRLYSKQNDPESDSKMERLLLDAVELNDYAGAPMLAKYYFMHYRFDDVIRICGDFMKNRMNAVMPILYGESALLSDKPELIPPLTKRVWLLHGRQSKMIASYLSALTAFSEGNRERLHKAMLESGSTIDTPLSALISLHLAVYIDSPKEILQRLERIMKNPPFLDFQVRARSIALGYVLKKMDADFTGNPELLNTCAEIAAMIETPDDDVSLLRRIILLDHFKRNVMTEDELQKSLRTFPGDPVFLKIAAEFSLSQKHADRAMEYIAEYNALEGVPDKNGKQMTVLRILALDQLGRKDEAQKEFRSLVGKEKDATLVYLYFEYCVENSYLDSLKSYVDLLETFPKDSPVHASIPFVRAEILLFEGQKDQALSLFEKTPSDDPLFVFHAASRLDENGRKDAAFKRYLSIRDTYPDKALVNARLSELYQEKGDAAMALACARAAWEQDRNNLLSRYVYGKRLYEAGQYQDAIAVLKFPQYQASFPKEMLDVWSKAVHAQIKDDFDHERYNPAQDNIKFLLIYFPEDKEGLEYAEKIKRIRRHETVGGNGK